LLFPLLFPLNIIRDEHKKTIKIEMHETFYATKNERFLARNDFITALIRPSPYRDLLDHNHTFYPGESGGVIER